MEIQIHADDNINNSKGSSSWVWQMSDNTQVGDKVWGTQTLDLLNRKSIGFNRLWTTTTVPSFKSSSHSNQGFPFIVLTYTPTYTHCNKAIAISAPPYYIIGADNDKQKQQVPQTLSNLAVCATWHSRIAMPPNEEVLAMPSQLTLQFTGK